MADLLEIQNLSVNIDSPQGVVEAVRDVSLTIREGEVLALVGESGCGKSMLCRAIMRLLPKNARIVSGSIRVDGREISACSEREMRRIRGKLFSMVFQDPMTALNPTMPVGDQIAEAARVHDRRLSRKAARERAVALMEKVGVDRAQERSRQCPYHFSGGMRQRSVMAMALASGPRLLLADEPTTALDVTIQAQILDLFREIQSTMHTSTLFVTHDLGVVARVADRVAVMYAGKIVELGTAEEIFYDPRHPYTQGLLHALPAYSKGKAQLSAIPGMPPSLICPPKGDAFACRNEFALGVDYVEQPPNFRVSDTHWAATWLLDPNAPKVGAAKGEKNCGK